MEDLFFLHVSSLLFSFLLPSSFNIPTSATFILLRLPKQHMIKYFIFIILLSSVSFAIVGQQCPLFQEDCIAKACGIAQGELSDYGECVPTSEFDYELYTQEVERCNTTYDFCLENDGLIKNMSCCGPIFILLSTLALIVKASN